MVESSEILQSHCIREWREAPERMPLWGNTHTHTHNFFPLKKTLEMRVTVLPKRLELLMIYVKN